MKIVRAARAGFCMGVSLALKKLEEALDRVGLRICTLGPIIHNPQVLSHFKEKGVHCLRNSRDAQADDFVLIRAHGIPREDEALLRGTSAHVEDATCPKVKKAQLAIENATANGAVLLLFGEASHPEVRGLVSYAAGESHVFGSLGELDGLEIDPARSYVLAAQTTQNREIFQAIKADLEQRLPRLLSLSTICDATRLRQEEARAMAENVDIMIVVGGRESGNTRRLASLAAETGIPALHIETAAELEGVELASHMTIGLTAGASTPAAEIDAVESWLLEHGRVRRK